MSHVWVRRDEAERGGLPARCARSGQRCVTRYRCDVRTLSPALEWAAWRGLWPFVAESRDGTIVLPLLPWRHGWARALGGVRDGSAALLLVGLVAALLTGGGVSGRIAGALVIAAVLTHVVAAIAGLLTVVDVRADVTGQWISLSGVHPDFAAEAERVTTRPPAEPMLATVETVRPADVPSAADRPADRPAEAG